MLVAVGEQLAFKVSSKRLTEKEVSDFSRL
jgi:hypothetical protein